MSILAIQGPVFFGQLLENVLVYPANANPLTGTLTLGSASDLCAGRYFDSIRINATTKEEEVSGANAGMENWITTKDGHDVEINEIRHHTGDVKVYNGFIGAEHFVFKVLISPDGGTTEFLISGVCKRSSLNDDIGEGKSLAALSGKACGFPLFYGDPADDPYL